MDWNQVAGRWKAWRSRAKKTWRKLRNKDLEIIRGRRDQLVRKLQELYGIVRSKAKRQVVRFGKFLEESGRGRKVVRTHLRIVRRRKRSPTSARTGRRSR